MNLKCPNIDNDTLEALKNMGINPSVKNRIRIYYTICIVLRLFIAGLAYQFKDTLWLPYITLIISMFTSYRLYNNLEGKQWWSRSFHFYICILLTIISTLIIFGYIRGEYISYLLYLDVIGGFTQSLFINRC
tara:strand:+ start:125 stop:520 length:396 start_codon:yes stop_codon:yes gene_type:complete